jgi:tight adherence protein B
VIALLTATAAGLGVHLLWTSLVLGVQGVGPARAASRIEAGRRAQTWLVQAGLEDVQVVQFAAVTTALGAAVAAGVASTFGGAVPVALGFTLGSSWPLAIYRGRRRHRRERAQAAWPRVIEEIRILTGSGGRSIPQALFEAGGRAPDELRGAFTAAHREWLLTTDFERAVGVLKERLGDPTADAAAETLLVAHQIGGVDLDSRLEALADDRSTDVQGRRDARAQQAGVRFARRFVLLVPVGMAAAGMSLGEGRAAYQTASGQAAVTVGMVLVGLCWIWAGRIMAIPDEERVFAT